ncbi:MAG: phenylalanine--tRNA ligase subunit beta [Coriobacteriia bacterium]|nr:phenylalanine--tRNA ligase subunit beta [Coriobacteriia bacterium]
MKVSLKWLQSMVEVPARLDDFVEKLDLTGTAVESVSKTGVSLEGIFVGHILKKEKHPDADTLWVTTVDVGNNNLGADASPEALQIVCGAQNFQAGNKVAVALVGTVLPDGNKIKKTKLRGVESRGMNCSARELGLGDDHEGIMILPADAPIGMPFAEYYRAGDTILDLEITPNRPDCMSMLGIAREVAAVYGSSYQLGRRVPSPPVEGKASDMVHVKIDDIERCARYTARIIKGVTVGPSPEWLAERITAAGARPINNIVDATNYIMFETGQPLHAFDLDTLAKDTKGRVLIGVRAAKEGEKFTTLDEVERTLSSDTTVIVDGNAAGKTGVPIALAGVMGGLDSEVTETTINVLLESASFNSGHTSRTSRSLKLFSESSARFERGVDDATCDDFSARAAALIAELGGGTACEGVVDCYPAPRILPILTLRFDRMRDVLGANISNEEALELLVRLGCVMEPLSAEACRIIPPSFRPDLEREVDLYEEVLRLWGMDRVVPQLPGGEGRIGSRTREQVLAEKMGFALRALGLNETMTYAFASEKDMELLGMQPPEGAEPVKLINPLNAEQSELRLTILPGLLRSVAYNQKHGVSDVQLYEVGAVFLTGEGRKQPLERPQVAGVLCGSWNKQAWNREAQALDFFDAKGVIEQLARELCVADLRFVALSGNEAPWLTDGQAALVKSGSTTLGWLGTIHPRVAEAFEANSPIIAFELEIKLLLRACAEARPFEPVSVFPAVELDLALVVDADLPAEQLLKVARSAGGKLLSEVRIFDVFADEAKLGAHKKSLALAFCYRSADRTLTSEEVDKLHSKVIRKLEAATGGVIRS